LRVYSGDGGYDDAQAFDGSGLTTMFGGSGHPPTPQWMSSVLIGAACAASAPSDNLPKPGGVGCGTPIATDPISIATGNVFEVVEDYATTGQNPLAFTRYYNSMSSPDTYAVALGSNWRHIYDRYLHIINPSAIYGVNAEREDGQYISFSSSAGTYTTDTDLDYKLTRSGSTWTLTDPDDTVETYTASGTEATLNTIKRRNGYTLTLHYTSGKLTSVTDSYTRSLGLSYSSAGLLAGLTTPDSLALSYGYIGFSSGGHLLSTVGYNTTPATHQTYLYENTGLPSALTGITDENGHQYATWAYDGMGRAISSQLAGGVKVHIGHLFLERQPRRERAARHCRNL
jgi:hypothetical protein